MVNLTMKCKKHPAYKGIRKPSTKKYCESCKFIWDTFFPDIDDLVVERVDD